MNLTGKVAVVTGGSKGVGRGVARELAGHGARVFVTGRSAPDREPLDDRTMGIRCDHRDDGQVQATFSLIIREAGTFDALVNSLPLPACEPQDDAYSIYGYNIYMSQTHRAGDLLNRVRELEGRRWQSRQTHQSGG